LALSGLLVFSIYTIQANFGFGEPLTTAKAFTSLALVSMMTTPASMLLQATSAVFSASGNIVRLEEYLKKPKLKDPRVVANSSSTKLRVEKANEILVLEHVILDVPSKLQRVEIDHGIVKHSVTMISGPVGSGKSTLCRVILGESAPVSGKVTIRAGSIAYCSTTPWLRNTTIKDNVLCDKHWDEQWYQEIITVCDLGTDLLSLPLGDATSVGSRGVNLSGGQKHRVALARALYSRSSFLLLDETFGALDRRTKDTVAERVVKHARQQGLTLIFVSHDGQWCSNDLRLRFIANCERPSRAVC
jgi:ATP-binding cassette subfamily C (CFTR/MRP) protein 1